jgi:predicted PurR-regulated permease PerM
MAEESQETPMEATQQVVEEIHAEAEVEAGVSEAQEYGEIGRPFDRSSPFFIGFVGAGGVLTALALAWVVVSARQLLSLLVLAFFIALGLEPVVVRLHKLGLPRWLAVALVLLCSIGLFAGFLLLAVPVVVDQASNLANALPGYLHQAKDRHTELGKLDARFHIVRNVQNLLTGKASFQAAVGIGKVVLDAVVSIVLVVVVAAYLLVDLPRVRRGIYRLAPRSRRARMVLLTDEIFSRVGGYVLGNLLTSGIAGIATWAWCLALGVPYALLLGVLVAILDLIPMVGSTIGGIIVSLVALTVSVHVAIATAIFYVGFRWLEDYLLTPRVMARTVSVPGLVTVVATVIGGTVFGIIGAFVAIPIAAAVLLLLDEVLGRRLEER